MSERRTIANEILLREVDTALRTGRKVKLRAKGDSMHPTIRGEKDILVIGPATALRVGDVALARIDANRYVVHRIVGKADDRIVLAGDANIFIRETCRTKDVSGIVVTLIRGGREIEMLSFRARFKGKAWCLLFPLRRWLWRIINYVIKHKRDL